MSRLWFGFGLVAIVFAALSGCGQKGPLYLPDDEQAPMNEAPMLPVEEIAARVGTPCYIYSRATLERHWHAFDDAFADYPHTVCYAVKANSNLAVLNLFARLGSGFDIVSGGELERVLRAGGAPEKIVFSGVGKSLADIERAVEVGIACFNVESEPEIERLESVARRQGRRVAIAVRINPDVDAQTHPYISTGLKENKFGIAWEAAPARGTRGSAGSGGRSSRGCGGSPCWMDPPPAGAGIRGAPAR